MFDAFLEAFGAHQFVDWAGLLKLLLRFALNFTVCWAIVRWIYVRLYRWNEYVFTYFALNFVTFTLCLVLQKVTVELGFALGLFAVFGILRYRTEQIQIRDLTYLFVVIGVAILNAVSNEAVSVLELLGINALIFGTTYVIEVRSGVHRESKQVLYDRIELVTPGRRAELVEDLEARIGLAVVGVEVIEADLLRDVVRLRVECKREIQ